jgi:hypothetical protein
MNGNDWFGQMTNTVQHMLNSLPAASGLDYGWTQQWPPLLAGLVVVAVAGVLTREMLKGGPVRSDTAAEPDIRDGDLDLRNRPAPAVPRPPSPPLDMVRRLEQLRSLIRSALAALTPIEGTPGGISPVLYERIFNLGLEDAVLLEEAPMAARKALKALLRQLETLKARAGTDASTANISGTLIKMNTSARDLVAALANPPVQAEAPALQRQ